MPLRRAVAELGFVPRRERDFSLVFLGKLLIQFALAFFQTYQLYFLTDRLGIAPEEAASRLALAGGLGVVCTIGGAMISGKLSDRIGRRKPFLYLACALIALGMLVFAITDSVVVYIVAVLIVLLGAGIFGAVDLALVTAVLPGGSRQSGKFMSTFQIAANFAQASAPLVAPLVLAIGGGGNYAALFITGAVIVVGAGLVAVPIRGSR